MDGNDTDEEGPPAWAVSDAEKEEEETAGACGSPKRRKVAGGGAPTAAAAAASSGGLQATVKPTFSRRNTAEDHLVRFSNQPTDPCNQPLP